MEPLTINCGTCNSRIRVRNPALLGQLVNCPKCDSMVLVTPPDSSPESPPLESSLPDTGAGAPPVSQRPPEPQIEVQRHDRHPVDSAALTQEGLPPELIDATPQPPLHTSSEYESDDEYRLSPERSDFAVSATEADSSIPAPPPVQSADQLVPPANIRTAIPDAPSSWEAATRPHLPSADWTSDATTKTRQLLLVGFLGFAGVILAALLFVGFLRWYSTEDTTHTASSATLSEAPQDSEQSTQIEDGSTPATQDGPPTTPALRDTNQLEDDRHVDDRLTAGDEATGTGDEVSLETATPNNLGVSPTGEVPRDGSTPATANEALIPLAPNAGSETSVTENPTEGSTESVAADMDEPDAEQPSVELPKQLQAFGPMLQYEIQPQFSDAMEILTEAPVTAEDLGLTTSVEPVEAMVVDVQSQSQIMVPALVIGELPLSQFASLWSNLSGIPTSVDLASLAAAGIDRNQSIGLSMVKSVTLGSLIDQLGAPIGLKAVSRDNRYLELVAPAEAIEAQLPPDISLAGLVDADQQAWLLESLPRLFPQLATNTTLADAAETAESLELAGSDEAPIEADSPSSLGASGDPAEPSDSFVAADEPDAIDDAPSTADSEPAESDPSEASSSEASSSESSLTEALVWRIEQGNLLRPLTASGGEVDPRIWSTAIYLLEGWRHAAGLPTTQANFDPALHSAQLIAPSDVAGLDFVLQQVQAEARPVAQVVPSICRSAGLHAWMDWPALNSLGMGVNSTALVLTSARPLRRALADYASQFSFVVAVLDSQSLRITSNHAYRTSPQLYVVPSQGESVEVWTSRLRPLTPAAADGSGVGQVVVIPTPDGKFMLVRCCPMQIEFQ